MAARETMGDDRERRQLISQELAQLKQMSKSLRTRAMRSFMQRVAADRLKIERPKTPPVAA